MHVRYRGDACAPNVFLETIKSVFESFVSDGPRASVRIDPDFYTTHYLGDVLQAIAKKVECTLESGRAGPPVELVVGSGNESQGDMDVSVQNLHVHMGDQSDAPILRDRRVAVVSNAIQEFLSKGHFMIVLNDTPSKDQVEFWRDLWEGGLKRLIKDGLFLVKMIDEEQSHVGKHPDEPDPEQILVLPVEFDESRQADAIEDLARILIREVKRAKKLEVPLNSAIMTVKAFVFSNKRSISRLHVEWSGVLMDLVRDAR